MNQSSKNVWVNKSVKGISTQSLWIHETETRVSLFVTILDEDV